MSFPVLELAPAVSRMPEGDSEFDSVVSTVETVADDAFPASPTWEWNSYSLSWWQVLEVISSVLGIVGNFLVMLVLYKRRAANRVTDTLIRSLALADFLTSILIFPQPAAKTVPNTTLGHFYCKMTLPGLCLFVCFTSSIYILTAISVERFIAVVYPLYMGRLQTRKNILYLVIGAIWISTTIVYAVFVATVVIVDPDRYVCRLHYSTTGKAVNGIFFLTYRLIFPACVMVVTQIAIACSLHRRSIQLRGMTSVPFHIKARNQVLKLMLIVIIIYIICWGPGQVIFFLYSVDVLPPTFIGSTLHKFIITLTTYNSCLNPIVYAAWFPDFRVAVRRMLSCKSRMSQDNSSTMFGERVPETYTNTTESTTNI